MPSSFMRNWRRFGAKVATPHAMVETNPVAAALEFYAWRSVSVLERHLKPVPADGMSDYLLDLKCCMNIKVEYM